MKNVLLLAHDDCGQDARVQVAIDVVKALDGHLTCLDVSEMPIPIVDAFSHAGLKAALVDIMDREAANRIKVEMRLSLECVSWDWMEGLGDIADCMKVVTGLADLIVLNQRLRAGSPHMEHVAAELLLDTRRPVLAVPEQQRKMTVVGARALIAWDGSDEAIQALRVSVPLLLLATEAIIVEVDVGSIRIVAEDAAAYLSRHGVKATIERCNADAASVVETLISSSDRLHADYIVMGGFGHWRLMERILHGTSHEMLRQSRIPLLMAH